MPSASAPASAARQPSNVGAQQAAPQRIRYPACLLQAEWQDQQRTAASAPRPTPGRGAERTKRRTTEMAGFYKAEYIWIDGTEPTAKLRSKTKIVPEGDAPPIWGFDGSSTNQAPGSNSDCVLKPVFVVPGPDPRRQEQAGPQRGPAHRHEAASQQHARRLRRDGQEVRGARHLVRHRAGVHLLRRLEAPRLARQRLPRARRAPTTAASAPTRSSAARSSRLTPMPASSPGSPSAASTAR